jgi:hypothetical protein
MSARYEMRKPTDCAFPHSYDADGKRVVHLGLSIREHFAAMAMQGLLATGLPGYTDKLATLYTARRAAEYADALIAELAK